MSARRWSTTPSAPTPSWTASSRSRRRSRRCSISPPTAAASGGFVSFERALTDAIEGAERAFHRSGHVSGLTTGLRDLDGKIGGLHPSDLLILAGRPGMGKTALATKIAFGAAKALLAEARAADPNTVPKAAVAIFSLEMSAEQLATRLLSRGGAHLRRPHPPRRHRPEGVRPLRAGLARDRRRCRSRSTTRRRSRLSALRTRCRRLKRTKGLALVVVDYLQLMRPSAGTRPENRVLEISQITQGLKAIAKELAVPVLALSQLSRAVESREDKRPQLSDLRESGTIEQDADVVMFIYRDEYYLAAARCRRRWRSTTATSSRARSTSGSRTWSRSHNQAELHHRQAAARADRQDRPVLRGGVHPVRRSRPGPFRVRLMSDPRAGATLEVDLAAIVANWRLLAARHRSGPVAGVVKADAYGLGAAAVAPALFAAGCRHFFVATLDEALALRPLLPEGDARRARRAAARHRGRVHRPRPHPGAEHPGRDRRLDRRRAPGRPGAAGDPACRYRHGPARAGPGGLRGAVRRPGTARRHRSALCDDPSRFARNCPAIR